MAKRFERVFRDRPLTPEEFARDEAIRRKVREEFPPARSEEAFRSDSLSAALREAIRGSDKSVYQIAKEADVSQIVISRFLSGERDIRMATADKLAGALGLRLATGA
jgi:transcriptional regulator with XRE-family HTH domain